MDPDRERQRQSEPLMGSANDGDSRPASRAGRDEPPAPAPAHHRSHDSLPAMPFDTSTPSPSNERPQSADAAQQAHLPSAPRERPRVRFGADTPPPEPHSHRSDHRSDHRHDHGSGAAVPPAHARPKKSIFQPRPGLGSRTSSHGDSEAGGSSGHASPQRHAPSPDHPSPLGRPALTSHDASEPATRAEQPAAPPPARQDQPEPPRRALFGASDGSEDITNEPLGNRAGDRAAQTARNRAQLLSQSLARGRKSNSAPGSRTASPHRRFRSVDRGSPELAGRAPEIPRDFSDLIQLEQFEKEKKHRKFGLYDSDSETEKEDRKESKLARQIRRKARRLINSHLISNPRKNLRVERPESSLSSGQITPDREKDEDYVSKPPQYRAGVLGALLNLYGDDALDSPLGHGRYGGHGRHDSKDYKETPTGSPMPSPPSSGHNTPKRKIPKWNEKNVSGGVSTGSLSSLINSSTALSATGAAPDSRPTLKPRQHSSGNLEGMQGRRRNKGDVAVQIRMHVEDVIARHEYLIKSCRALMKYGAPTHRLEEYMRRSARALEIDGQFMYIPGCMMISFDDPVAHTTQVKLVREVQGIDLGRLLFIHDVYKAVIHDKMGAREASEAMVELENSPPRYNIWVRIIFYGLASALVGPFAFGARPIDLPPMFVLGCALGFMQLYMATKSESYFNVFEISAAVFTSFLARALGSINGGNLFCFPALAESSIAMILPGYLILGAALELQAKSIIAGSVRMVYAIIYSLLLGFGLTIGIAFYGAVDPNASQDTVCRDQTITGALQFAFVPPFTLCLVIINQAKWRQMPVMIVMAFAGYLVNYYAAKHFSNNAQVANTLGALAVGLLGNIYSRVFHGMSAAAILPGILVQIPSSLTASGSLISGITTANQILSNGTDVKSASSMPVNAPVIDTNGTVFNVSFSLIQIAIGIAVGLFCSSLIVYPFGKKRSGLFSF